jgi:hypothetical protein
MQAAFCVRQGPAREVLEVGAQQPKTSLSVRIFPEFRVASEMSPNTAASQAVECCAPIPFVTRHATDRPNVARPRGHDALLLRTVSNPIRGERRFYSSAPLGRCGGAAACLTGRPRKPNETEGRSRVSPRRCRLSFRLPSSPARLAGPSYLRHRGSQSNPIGERIPSALIVLHALWRPALDLLSGGHGESAKAPKPGSQQHSARHQLPTESGHTA